MSGDRVVLAGETGSIAARLVHATARLADVLATAPFGLGRLVGDALGARVIDEPERAVRWLLDGGPEMNAVTADDLGDVIGPLVDRLER